MLKGKSRGFLGPIGDDLPSLIPLLFALVIFFSVFTFTFQVFERKSDSFQSNLDALKIVRVLKSSGYISSPDYFAQRCNEVTSGKLKFIAGITNAASAPEQFITDYLGGEQSQYRGIDVFNLNFFKSSETEEEFRCSNASHIPENVSGTMLMVKILPIVVEDKRIVKPMHLVVVAWQ
ncbi:MAG: hypothetical protein V1494_02255 [Candidatus Diapherotrites archaeon]